jgi:hypothetical protein
MDSFFIRLESERLPASVPPRLARVFYFYFNWLGGAFGMVESNLFIN